MEAKNNQSLQESELRSDEIQDVLNEPPNSLLNWANLSVALILLAVVAFSWFVQYPDTINGKAVISSANPPIQVMIRKEGTIENVWATNGTPVEEGQVILSLDGPLTPVEISNYKSFLSDTEAFLDAEMMENFPEIPTYIRPSENQELFNELTMMLNRYYDISPKAEIFAEERALRAKIGEYEEILKMSQQEALLLQQEFESAQKQFEMQKKEYDLGYITKSDFLRADRARLQSEISLKANDKSVIRDRLSLQDLRQQLLVLKEKKTKDVMDLRESIRFKLTEVYALLNKWENLYVLKAPISGIVAFPGDYAEGQFIPMNKAAFTIVPKPEDLEVKASVMSSAIGNLQAGHKARLELDIYPANSYGFVEGNVKSIAILPDGDTYTITISLPQGLRSNYGNLLEYRPQMTARLEVITEEVKLFDRVFGSLFSVAR